VIRSALLAATGLPHAHSTRQDGAVGRPTVPGAAQARAALVRAAGGEIEGVCVAEQVHGARVAVVASSGLSLASTDAIVTRTPAVPLLVQGADCPLLAFHDPVAGVAAVAHSGWRGTVARIAAATIAAMGEQGASRERIRVAVFPGIAPCCFEVGPEVEDAFVTSFGTSARGWFVPGAQGDRRLFDLRAPILATLDEAGVLRDRVDAVPGCTACDGRFFSHRASRGGPERHGLCVTLSARPT
jgi:purine-nucleoside/S-methyl-5'-thioadenosine phosphorylase / adenosine deaminase